MQHRRSNASSTLSTHSGGRSNCAAMSILWEKMKVNNRKKIRHIGVAHKQKDIVELLLKSGYDPNAVAVCHCKGACTTSGNIPLANVLPPKSHSMTPEMCSICSQLRVVSILDQSPLAVAVRAQSPEMVHRIVTGYSTKNLSDKSSGNVRCRCECRR